MKVKILCSASVGKLCHVAGSADLEAIQGSVGIENAHLAFYACIFSVLKNQECLADARAGLRIYESRHKAVLYI